MTLCFVILTPKVEGSRAVLLQAVCAEVFVAKRAEVCRRNVENSLATSLAVSLHAKSSTGVSHENARREFRVGIELEAVFDHVRVFLVHAGLAGTDHETTVSEAAVVLVEFFFADEVDRGVVFIEVVRHRLDAVVSYSSK